MAPISISAPVARRFLVQRHLLAPARSLPATPDGVRHAFERLGSLQFDPLGVAGRNHDLALHARVRDYEPAWTTDLLYTSREFFETYNKGLSLLPTSQLPWFRQAWDRFAEEHREDVFVRHGPTVERVLARIRDEGPLSSLDFEKSVAVDWYWGPTSEARAVLEALAEAGILSLARRDGNRRYYDLTERLYPAELLAVRPPQRDQLRHKLLSRYQAHGLLGEGGQSELWSGIAKARRGSGDPAATVSRVDLRQELLERGDLVAVQVEGVRGLRYMLGSEQHVLHRALTKAAAGDELVEPSVVFLAPLDPLVWDRHLLRQLFDFDYVWEVYVPERKRRWGYYVLPLLWGDRLVGRIEPRIDRDARTIRILGIWWQPGFKPRLDDAFVQAMRTALAAYMRFGGARRIEWADRAGSERRLFGVRPSPA